MQPMLAVYWGLASLMMKTNELIIKWLHVCVRVSECAFCNSVCTCIGCSIICSYVSVSVCGLVVNVCRCECVCVCVCLCMQILTFTLLELCLIRLIALFSLSCWMFPLLNLTLFYFHWLCGGNVCMCVLSWVYHPQVKPSWSPADWVRGVGGAVGGVVGAHI